MKRFSEQLKKQAETVRMRASEKNSLRERVVSYMEYHPLPKEIASVTKKREASASVLVSEPFKVLRFNTIYTRSFAGMFAVLFIVGVPFIAERSLPGDILYPVKVQFNEEVRSSLALSPYAKVVWETERLERRVAEARILALAGKLGEEEQTKVALAVKQHSEAAQMQIAELRQSNSDDAAIAEIAFTSALEVQSEVLEGHIEKNTLATVDTVPAPSPIAEIAQAVATARDEARASESNSRPSYEKLFGRVEMESTNVYELFNSIKDEASAEEVANVERRLSDIERKIATAVALKEGRETSEDVALSTMSLSIASKSTSILPEENGTSSDQEQATQTEESTQEPQTVDLVVAEEEAITLLRDALRDIQKLLSYMTHIDVRQNVSIEDLIPVTLTTEERVDELMQQLDDILARQVIIQSRVLDISREEKVVLGQQELERIISEALVALQGGEFDTAETLLDEGTLIANDLDTLTSGTQTVTEDEEETETQETASSTEPIVE